MNEYHPSKVLKYCPYCGSARFTWDGVKSFACADCQKKLFIDAASAVAVIIENDRGEIILTRRAYNPSKGALDLPGGFVDLSECAEDAARREVKEELGLDITELRYIASFPNEYLYGGLLIYTLDMAFVAKVANSDNLVAADDVASASYFRPDAIPFDEIAFESIKNILKFYTHT